jgi:hypothetical protein
MTLVYRGMREAADGLPLEAQTARSLGVRPDIDIPVDEDGNVEPGLGGMSTTPDSPFALPRHRLSRALGGESDDPCWEFDLDELPAALRMRIEVEDDLVDCLIEPATTMTFYEYEEAISNTRGAWRKYEQ